MSNGLSFAPVTLLALVICRQASAADGVATIAGNTTGGAGGPIVTVSTAGDFFNHAVTTIGPRIIQV